MKKIKDYIKKIVDILCAYLSKTKSNVISIGKILGLIFYKTVNYFVFHKWLSRWIICGIISIAMLLICYKASNSVFAMFCSISIPIAAMIIIMMQNNEQIEKSTKAQIDTLQHNTNAHIETLRETSQNQIQTFIEQCQNIVYQLKEMVDVLGKISKQTEEQLEIEKQNRLKSEEIGNRLQEEQIERQKVQQARILRIKPDVCWFIFEKRHNLFWKHIYLQLSNNGGDANNIHICIQFYDTANNEGSEYNCVVNSIIRGGNIQLDLDDVNTLKIFKRCKAVIKLRDKEDRLYEGISDTSNVVNYKVKFILNLKQ